MKEVCMNTGYHKEVSSICFDIEKKLKKYGILTDMDSGKISYGGAMRTELKCKQLYLLRHGETIGTSTHRFMSINSANSYLTEYGKNMLIHAAEQIKCLRLDCILYSDIPRVKGTADIICSKLDGEVQCINIPWMVGIDNAGWEGKTREELSGIDKADFYQREVEHNIFAKSSHGSSWGDVLVRCAKLIEYLNINHKERKILLISQGSILIGIRTILKMDTKPWEYYNADRFFGLMEEGQNNYGKLQEIYTQNVREG